MRRGGHGRDDVDGVGRSGARDRRSLRARRRLAPRGRGVCGVGDGVPGAALGVRRRRSRRLARRQPAQVDARARRLLAAVEPPAGGAARRVLARAGVPAHAGRGRLARRLRPGAGPPVPVAEAVGGAALLRAGGPAAADSRARAAGGAVRGLGAGGAWVGGLGAAALLARLLPAGRIGRGERGAARARERDAASCSSRTRSSTGGTCCGSRSVSSGRRRTTCGTRGRCCAARPRAV